MRSMIKFLMSEKFTQIVDVPEFCHKNVHITAIIDYIRK